MDGADWADPNARALAINLDGSDDPDRAQDGSPMFDDDFLVLINSWWEPLGFVLPPTRPGAHWHAEIDSHDPAAPVRAIERGAGDQVTVGPRSIAVLRSTLAAAGSPAGLTWEGPGSPGKARAHLGRPGLTWEGPGSPGKARAHLGRPGLTWEGPG